MIGVIVLSGPFPGMHGLDAQRSPSLLPLGDRPALQHIIESLVTQGITSIELIVGHAPERVEALLGNGDRWGCHFRYHLAAQPERPYRSLKVIQGISTEPWVLIHAERYPCVDFYSNPLTETVLFYNPPQSSLEREAILKSESAWGGTALLPAAIIDDTFANYTFEELSQHFEHLALNGSATIISTSDWIDVSSPGNLLESQARLLDKQLSGLLISGSERRTGVWISRNVTVHPSATLNPPLYIGPNSRIGRGVTVGPYAVIGGDCIVDSNTSVENSLILEGSYVGEALEVHKAIVAHNLLVNVHLDASIDISEDFLLGRLGRRRSHSRTRRILQSILASLLVILFLPISLLSLLYFRLVRGISYASLEMLAIPVEENPSSQRNYSLLCLGSDAWSIHRSAGWQTFLRQFLPGLFAVLCGRLNLVGLPPRTSQEIESISDDWRAIYVAGRAGLITEASTAAADTADEIQLYLADAYYSVQRSWSHDFMLFIKYFGRLILPKRQPQDVPAAKASEFHAKSESLETK